MQHDSWAAVSSGVEDCRQWCVVRPVLRAVASWRLWRWFTSLLSDLALEVGHIRRHDGRKDETQIDAPVQAPDLLASAGNLRRPSGPIAGNADKLRNLKARQARAGRRHDLIKNAERPFRRELVVK